MSSQNPDDLQDELKEFEFTGDFHQLPELRFEARKTVESQQETLKDIDTKANQILRLNILLIGVIVSALSIAAQTGDGSNSVDLSPFVNPYMELGIAALILSTALAAITYTASELDIGVSSENLKSLMKAGLSEKETEELLIKNYIARINFNRSTNIRNIPLITSTIVLVVAAVIFFSLGMYNAIISDIPLWILIVTVALLLIVVFISGLVKQTKRAIQDMREWR